MINENENKNDEIKKAIEFLDKEGYGVVKKDLLNLQIVQKSNNIGDYNLKKFPFGIRIENGMLVNDLFMFYGYYCPRKNDNTTHYPESIEVTWERFEYLEFTIRAHPLKNVDDEVKYASRKSVKHGFIFEHICDYSTGFIELEKYDDDKIDQLIYNNKDKKREFDVGGYEPVV